MTPTTPESQGALSAEEILNKICKAREIFFLDFYILNTHNIKVPTDSHHKALKNPLYVAILDAIESYATQQVAAAIQERDKRIDELQINVDGAAELYRAALSESNWLESELAERDKEIERLISERDNSITDCVHLTNRIKNHWEPLLTTEKQRSAALVEALNELYEGVFMHGNITTGIRQDIQTIISKALAAYEQQPPINDIIKEE